MRGVISPCQKHGTARSQSVRQRGDFYRPLLRKGEEERPLSLPPPNLCVKGISNMKLGGGEGRASLVKERRKADSGWLDNATTPSPITVSDGASW